MPENKPSAPYSSNASGAKRHYIPDRMSSRLTVRRSVSTEVSTPPHESGRPEQVATCELEGIQAIGRNGEHGVRRGRESTEISSSQSVAKERRPAGSTEELQTSLISSQAAKTIIIKTKD